MSCVFCRIVAGLAPASVAYADPTAVVFLDIAPMTPGHLLVVPRTHVESLAELDPDVGAHLWRVGQRMAASLRRSPLRCDGVNFFVADGAAAFQEVPHLHLHVIPRWKGDGVKLNYKPGRPARADLDAQATDLRAAAERTALPND
ncbi:MAG TPA: HIT family protein [Mycobacteriales bacterium]|nr:HIT family protein [Mycobacteriales bacterium]